MLLWVLSAQYYTHDLCNAKQISNKANPYWKNRPGRSLPPDTRKRENRIVGDILHPLGWSASTCIAIVNELSFLFLRLPFGTTPAPEEYTTVSEAAINLGNNLLQDQSWDTGDINSPH